MTDEQLLDYNNYTKFQDAIYELNQMCTNMKLIYDYSNKAYRESLDNQEIKDDNDYTDDLAMIANRYLKISDLYGRIYHFSEQISDQSQNVTSKLNEAIEVDSSSTIYKYLNHLSDFHNTIKNLFIEAVMRGPKSKKIQTILDNLLISIKTLNENMRDKIVLIAGDLHEIETNLDNSDVNPDQDPNSDGVSL